MNKPEISIIFVNYNSTELLLNSIRSISELVHDTNYEIIIVDNASPDNGAERLKKELSDTATIITSKDNLGFGGANNLAIKMAKGKYLFFLNPDTILINNAIGILYKYFENAPSDVGALGASLYDKEGLPNRSAGTFPTPSYLLKVYLGCAHDSKILVKSDSVPVDFISGAALMIRKTVLDEVGIFDTQFFMYCEETDLQKRISDAGYSRLIVPQAQITHLDGGSYNKNNNRSARRRIEQDRSYCLYIKKHFSYPKYMAFRTAFFFVRLPGVVSPHYKANENFKFLKMLLS